MKSKWPLASDFVSALQNPETALKGSGNGLDLENAKIKNDRSGIPKGMSGNFAIVFKADIPGSGKLALRCFTKSVPKRAERYQCISDHLQQVKQTNGPNPLVEFNFWKKDQGIKVKGKRYPFVTMEWVEGETLYKWLETKCQQQDKGTILSMADRWQELIDQLRTLKISHGDLQHGNVMVTPKGQLKLVDYDCMCVPRLIGEPNLELGVEPYQHRSRDDDTVLSLELDNFSANFIYTALRALAAEPGLWLKHVVQRDYDKILFRKDDFIDRANSVLYRDLMKSPDREVPRFTEDLFDLWDGSFEDVPPLHSFILSWDDVQVEIDTGNWREVVEMADRLAGQERPDDLEAAIQKARQMVICLDNLIKAVKAGDEQSMVTYYQPVLLTNWHEARNYLDTAQSASTVIPLQKEMRLLDENQQGRELVTLWGKHKILLENRKSMEKLKTVISQWKKRNRLCDALLELRDQKPAPIDQLEDNWKKLEALGGHPEIQPFEKKIRFLIRRQRSYEEWSRIPATMSQPNDQQRVSLWKDKLFTNWPTAETKRPVLDASRLRLAIIDLLEKLCQRHDLSITTDGERQLTTTAGQLPGSYPHSLDDRIKLARDRLLAYEQLTSTRDSIPIIDTRLASCYEKLNGLGGQAILSDDERHDCELAARRKPKILALQKLPEDLAADALDKKLLELWDEPLLSPCAEVQEWRERHAQAVKRKETLDQLEKAIESEDEFTITKIADEEGLRDYPFPRAWIKAIQEAERVVTSFQQLREAITTNNEVLFRDHFDRQVLKKYERGFENLRDGLEKMIQSAIMPLKHLGLKKDPFGKSLNTQAKDKDLMVTARWNWPPSRFTSECTLVITELLPETRLSPEDPAVIYLDPVLRDDYEAAGAHCERYIESAWKGYHVLVWAEVDVGIGIYNSAPIVLGQILP